VRSMKTISLPPPSCSRGASQIATISCFDFAAWRSVNSQAFPRFGYLLEHDGRPVGAILTIYSSISTGGTAVTRCNLSSWHVEPEYKGYGALLISQALKRKDSPI
jgi:hypothetical protein